MKYQFKQRHTLTPVIVAVLVLALFFMTHEPENNLIGMHYFSTANFKVTPTRFFKEISKQQAVEQTAYYVAVFGERGKISTYCKILRGKIVSHTKYEYGGDKLLKEKTENDEGTSYVFVFNESGEVISQEKHTANLEAPLSSLECK